jgi:hypothetical protein
VGRTAAYAALTRATRMERVTIYVSLQRVKIENKTAGDSHSKASVLSVAECGSPVHGVKQGREAL